MGSPIHPRVLLIECSPFLPVQTPISLGYIAAYLAEQGYSVKILQIGSDTRLSLNLIGRLLLDFRPAIVGFSAYQRNIFFVQALGRLCKSLLPDCTTVIGGPQATFLPPEALRQLPSIDLVCRGEGEVAMMGLAERMRAGESIDGTPCMMGRRPSGGAWEGPAVDSKEELDDYPSPYLTGALEIDRMDEAILLASRGCPYRCAFCYTPQAFGRKTRYHSVERVLDEIEYVSRKGLRRFWFADPSFTLDRTRIHGLLDGLLRRGLDSEFWLETRADLVDSDLLNKMKHAGVHTIAYGLESASPDVLQRIRKPIDSGEFERAVRLTQDAGIGVEVFSQYGLPGESFEDAVATLRFVESLEVPIRGNTNAQQMQLYFGTEVQREPARFGICVAPESPPLYISAGGRYHTDCMSESEIKRVRSLWAAASIDGGKRIVS
ncbi:MAG: radical SAM protein [Acidobacteriota bacterium]